MVEHVEDRPKRSALKNPAICPLKPLVTFWQYNYQALASDWATPVPISSS
jgi:hypothetical protein